MAKVIKAAIIAVAVVVLTVVAVNALGAAGALGSGFTAIAVGSTAAMTFVGTLVAGGIGMLTNKGISASAGNFGTKVTGLGGATPRQIIYGTARVGGTFVKMDTRGTKNAILSTTIVVAGHPCDGFDEMYFGETKLTFSSATVNGETVYSVTNTKFRNSENDNAFGTDTLARFTFHDGSQTAVDGLAAAGSSSRYPSTAKFLGCTYFYLELVYDPEKMPNIPKIWFVMRGKNIWDPRANSGNGAISTTDAQRQNPALQIRDYLTDTTYGLKALDSELNDGTSGGGFSSAANLCDTLVTLADNSTTERRYTSSGISNFSASGSGLIEAITTSCAGNLTYTNGKFNLFAGASQTAALTITDDKLLAPPRITTQSQSGELFNAVKSIYINKNDNYQASEIGQFTSSAFLAADTPSGEASANFKRVLELRYPFTTSETTAQRLQRISLKHQRQATTVDLITSLEFMKAQPNDWIYLTNERLGYTNKTFEIQNMSMTFLENDGQIFAATSLSLQEIDATVFDFVYSEYSTPQPNASQSVIGEVDISPPTIGTPVQITNVEGQTAKINIRAVWSNAVDSAIQGTEIQFKASGDSEYQTATLAGKGRINAEISNVKVGLTYNIRVRHFSFDNIYSDYSSVANITITQPDTITNPTSLAVTTDKPFNIELSWVNPSNTNMRAVDVHYGTSTGYTPSTSNLIGTYYGDIGKKKTVLLGRSHGLAYDQNYYFKIRAVNIYGSFVESGGSPVYVTSPAGQMKKVTTVDVDSISANKLSAGTIDASVITVNNLNASKITSGELTLTASAASAVKAGKSSFEDATTAGFFLGFTDPDVGSRVEGIYIGTATNGMRYDTAGGLVVSGNISATTGFIGGVKIATSTISVPVAPNTTGVYDNANTAFFIGADGKFSLKDKLSWNGTTLTINGGGTFSGALSAASGTFAGALSSATGTFSGSLSAANGTFSGSLSSASGTFTGALSGGTISIGSNQDIFKADSNGIYLGHSAFLSAPFRVNMEGNLVATKVTVSGTSPSISIGTNSTDTINLSAASDHRMWVGSSTPESANFKIHKDGTLTAKGMLLQDGNANTYFSADGFTSLAYSQIASSLQTRITTFESNGHYNLTGTGLVALKVTLIQSSSLTITVKASNLFSGLSTGSVTGGASASVADAIADIPDNFTLSLSKSTTSGTSGFTTLATQTFTKVTTGSSSSTTYRVNSVAYVPSGTTNFATPAEVDITNHASITNLNADGERVLSDTATYSTGVVYFRILLSTTDTSYDTNLNNVFSNWPRTLSVKDNGGTGFTVVDNNPNNQEITQAFSAGDITSVTAGTNLNGGGTSGAVTINLDSTITGNHTFEDNLTIEGNLTVQGTTTTVDTNDLNVKDKNITLNYSTGDSSGNANGAGITIQDAVNSTTNATILWDSSNDKFDFSHKVTTPSLDVGGLIEFNSLSGTGSVSVTDILNENNMSSNSATALATQASIKAYVLANGPSGSFLPLSGGTLTGGLTGTTATFSGALSALSATFGSGTNTFEPARTKRGTGTINNSSYSVVAKVLGDNLGSAVQMSVNGTSSNVVINSLVTIMVSHSLDITVESTTNPYTRLFIKIISDGNEDFDIYLMRNDTQSGNTTVALEIMSLNNETVFFTNSTTYSTTTHIHETGYGKKLTSTGGTAVGLNIQGNITTPKIISSDTTNSYLDLQGTASVFLNAASAVNLTVGTATIFQARSTGVLINSGALMMGGSLTTVIDSSRNLTNIGTISSGAITATADTNALSINTITNGTGAEIKFSDESSQSQQGFITYHHSDSAAYGGSDVFTLGTDQTALRVLADGLLMFKSGLAIKPASGTGAGTTLITSSRALQNITTGSFSSNVDVATGGGSFTVGGNHGAEYWTKSYSVSNTNIEALTNADGSSLETGGAYRFTGHIDGTGTDNSSRAVFWNEDGTWNVNITGQSGTSSNHILFLVSSGVPSVKTYHANNYTVRVWHERLNLNENTGTDNTEHYFGADGYMSKIGNDIILNHLASEKMRVNASGINITGIATVAGTTSSSAPKYTFFGDTDTGLGYVGTNAVGLIAGGSRKFYVSGTNAYFQNLSGGVDVPSLSIAGTGVIDASRNLTNIHDVTFDGVVRSTNNANSDGANFNVSTTNKDGNEYAYSVDRSGTVVAGIQIDGDADFVDLSAVTGAVSGKFAVMSTAVHNSFDFYNNGTSYLNGSVTVDDVLDITGTNRALKIAGTTVIDASRNLSNIGTISSGAITATSGIYANSFKGLNASSFTQGSAGIRLLGTFNTNQSGGTLHLVYNGGNGYNASNNQNGRIHIFLRTSNNTSSQTALDGNDFYASGHWWQEGRGSLATAVYAKQVSNTSYQIIINGTTFAGKGFVTVDCENDSSWSPSMQDTSLSGTYISLAEENRSLTNIFAPNLMAIQSSGTTLVSAEVAANSTVGFHIKKTGSTNQEWKIVDGQTVNGKLEFYNQTATATALAIANTNDIEMRGDGDVRLTMGSAGSVGSNNSNWLRGDTNRLKLNAASQGFILSNAGQAALTIDSSRNTLLDQSVMIGGSTVPAAKLHITGNSDVSDEDCMLIIEDVDGSAGSRIPSIMFRSNTGGVVTNQARIRGTDSQGLVFSSSSSLSSDFTLTTTTGTFNGAVKISPSTSTAAAVKLQVGTIQNTSSSALMQVGGFIRSSELFILHNTTGSADALSIRYTDNDFNVTLGEGSYTGILRANGYKVGTETVIDTSRNITNVPTAKINASTSTSSHVKLQVGTIQSTTSSAIAQFGGFLRASTYYILHDSVGGTNAAFFGYTGHDTDFTVGEGSYTGFIRANGYRVGTQTVIDASRNLTNIGTISSGAITVSQSADLHNQFISTGGNSKLSIISPDSGDAWINLSGATNEMSIGYERTSSEFRITNNDTLTSNVRLAIVSSTGNATLSGNLTVPKIISPDTNNSYLDLQGTASVFLNAASAVNLTVGTATIFQARSTGVLINSGALMMGGSLTTVIDSSRNLTNIGTINSGAITSTGKIQSTSLSINSGGVRSDVQEGEEYKYYLTGTGAVDGNWKKVCAVAIGTGLYRSLAMKVTLESQGGNFGNSNLVQTSHFIAVYYRSAGTQDDQNFALFNGNNADKHNLRVIKTATGAYELQIKQIINYSDAFVKIEVLSTNGGTVTMTSGLVNGSTSGTVYSPTPTTNVKKIYNEVKAGFVDSTKYKISNTEVIDSSRNLTNIGTINSGGITAGGTTEVTASEFRITSSAAYHTHLNYLNGGNNIISQANGGSTTIRNSSGNLFTFGSGGDLNIVSGGLSIGGQEVITSARALTNIGTINSGAITTVDVLTVNTDNFNYGIKVAQATGSGYAPASILLEATSSGTRGQGIYHYNTVADKAWFTGTFYNDSSARWGVAYKSQTSFNPDIAQVGNALFEINTSGAATFAGTISSGAITSTGLTVNSGTANVVASFISTDATAGIKLQDNSGNVELSASGSTFNVQPSGGASHFFVSTNVNSTGIGGANIPNGMRLGFDQSGTRSWTQYAAGGNLLFASGDGNGAIQANNFTASTYAIGTNTVIDASRVVKNVTLGHSNTGARFEANDWMYDTGGKARFYFEGGGRTFFGSDNGFVYRDNSDVGRATISNNGGLNLLSGGDGQVGSTVALAVSGQTVIDASRNADFKATTITGQGTTSSTYALRVFNGGPTEQMYIRDDGTTVFSGSNYVYITKTAGLYVDQSIKARGGIYNDTAGADLLLNDNVSITGTISSGAIETSGNINLRNNTTGDGATIQDINFLTTGAQGTDDRVAIIRATNQGGDSVGRGGQIQLFTRRSSSSVFNTGLAINKDGNSTFSGTINSGAITSTGALTSAGDLSLNKSDGFAYLSNIGTGNSGIYVRGIGTSNTLRSHTTGHFRWEVSGGEKMHLDSSGVLNVVGGYKINGTEIIDSSRNITAAGGTISGEVLTADASGTKPAGCKLHVGALNAVGSSAIAQFGGFLRASTYYILHESTGSGNAAFWQVIGNDSDFTSGSGSYTGIIRSSGYKVGTTEVIDSSRNIRNVLSIYNASNSQVMDLNNADSTIINDPDNHSCILLSGGSYDTNYYSNDTHYFRGRDVLDVHAIIDTTGIKTLGDYKVGSTTVIDGSRNLTNIGTINSGAITATSGIYANSLKGLSGTAFTQGSAGTRLLGTFNCGQAGQTLNLVYNGGQGYNANNDQNGRVHVFIRTSNNSSNQAAQNGSAFYASGHWWAEGRATIASAVHVKQVSNTSYQVFITGASFAGNGFVTVKVDSGSSWVPSMQDSTLSGTYLTLPEENRSLTEIYAPTFTSSGYKIGTTTVIDASRNLTNIVNASTSKLTLVASTAANIENYATGTGTPTTNWRIAGASSNLMTLSSSGALTIAGSLTQNSDRRIKDNIAPITDALSKICALQGSTYTRIDEGQDTTKVHAGLIAQDVEAILPEAAGETGEGIKTIDYTGVVALLVQSIKELKSEVDDLKTQLSQKEK